MPCYPPELSNRSSLILLDELVARPHNGRVDLEDLVLPEEAPRLTLLGDNLAWKARVEPVG